MNLSYDVPLEEISLEYIALAVFGFIILILWYIIGSQGMKYRKLAGIVKKEVEELKKQGTIINKLDNEISTYVDNEGQELEHWSKIENELSELSELPSLVETDKEVILRVHISKLKKDNVDVTATGEDMEIFIKSDEGPTLHCSYLTPVKIDPHELEVSYQGSTLEIRAPKASSEETVGGDEPQ